MLTYLLLLLVLCIWKVWWFLQIYFLYGFEQAVNKFVTIVWR